MLKNNKIWLADNETGESISLLPQKANQHGLIVGKIHSEVEQTVQVLAEGFSALGVPVFMTDTTGNLAGMMFPGENPDSLTTKTSRFIPDDADFSYQGYPVTLWDISGETGIPLRTTMSEIGHFLLSRLLGLNTVQSDTLRILFQIASDKGLLLIDTKDLKAITNYVKDHTDEFAREYGPFQNIILDVIIRSLTVFEGEGGNVFLGEPTLFFPDLIQRGANNRGIVNLLDSRALVRNKKRYSALLTWLLSTLAEEIPYIGSLDRPMMVVFVDEAQLLFKDADIEMINKTVHTIRRLHDRGVGVFLCAESFSDIPDQVISLLENRIHLVPCAYSTAEKKAVRNVTAYFRPNPALDTYQTLLSLEKGDALISFMDERGVPSVVQKGHLLSPQSRSGKVTDQERIRSIKNNLLNDKYAKSIDSESAFEILQRQEVEAWMAAEQAMADALAAKERARAEAAREKEKLRRIAQEEAAKRRAAKSVGATVAGTVGRESGKGRVTKNTFGGEFGKPRKKKKKTSRKPGILGTLFKK